MIKQSYIPLAILLSFSGILGWLLHTPGHNWGGDFALYLEQGQALGKGSVQQLWEDTTFSLEQSTMQTFSPELYSWGYPLLLAPVLAVTGLDYSWLKGYQLLLFLITLFLFYIWLKEQLSPTEALLLTAVWAVHPIYLLYTDVLLSEIPFIGALLLAVICINRCYLASEWNPRWADWVLCGLALWLVISVRHEGKLLLISLAVVHALQVMRYPQGWKVYFIDHSQSWIPYGIAAGGLLAMNLLLPSGTSSNFQHWALLDVNIIDNITYYAQLPEKLFGGWLPSTLYIATLSFFFWGMANRFSQDLLYIGYLVLLLGVLVVWPHQAGVRYVLSVFPFYLYFTYRGLTAAMELFSDAKQSLIPQISMALFGLLLGTQSVLIAANQSVKMAEGPEHPASRAMFDYINEQSRPDDVIVFFKPRVMHLYTGRRSVIIGNISEMKKGDYYAMHKYKGNYNQRLIRASEGDSHAGLSLVFENSRFKVFKINKESEPEL